jgi:hypothetical protein
VVYGSGQLFDQVAELRALWAFEARPIRRQRPSCDFCLHETHGDVSLGPLVHCLASSVGLCIRLSIYRQNRSYP